MFDGKGSPDQWPVTEIQAVFTGIHGGKDLRNSLYPLFKIGVVFGYMVIVKTVMIPDGVPIEEKRQDDQNPDKYIMCSFGRYLASRALRFFAAFLFAHSLTSSIKMQSKTIFASRKSIISLAD